MSRVEIRRTILSFFKGVNSEDREIVWAR